jgi:uncharacterized RDD family membrane protein YckC
MSDVAPGWYKDPAEPDTQRYWDGEGWIGDPLPADIPAPAGPPPAAVKRAAPARPPGTAPARPPGTAPPPPRQQPVPRPHPSPRPQPAPRPQPSPRPQPAPPPVPMGPPAAGVPLPQGVQWVGGVPFVLARPRPHGLPVAPLGLRFLARLIDFGVLLVLSLVANSWLLYLFVSDVGPYAKALLKAAEQGSRAAQPAIPNGIKYTFTLVPVIVVLVWLAYEVPAIAQSGQTYGKRIVGIKVMALEGTQPLGFARALRRWNPLALPVLLWTCGLGFVLQLVDSISPCLGGPLHLALHDRTAATVVVHSGRKGHEITPIPTPEKTGEQR